MYKEVIEFIKGVFPDQGFIPLHEPRFVGNEKAYVNEAIDSTFVSSVGAFVNRFEDDMARISGAKYAVATGNGTSALHMAMHLVGVESGDEVITQAFTFVATANAISYLKAIPVFVDISRDTLGLSPKKLREYLQKNAEKRSDGTYNKATGRRLAACVPMHTYGFPCEIDEIVAICDEFEIPVVEDAAESLGSHYKGKHTGTFGKVGIFSFNGNKTLTCGGGGAIVTNDEALAKRGKHITTQAKIPHKWEFNHDEIGYNYRLPNLNAAMACAQLEQLEPFIANKRALFEMYKEFFGKEGMPQLYSERGDSRANYWLNVLIFENQDQRDQFLDETNSNGVMTRPAWNLMHRLEMFNQCEHDGLEESIWLENRLVNIPSSVRVDALTK